MMNLANSIVRVCALIMVPENPTKVPRWLYELMLRGTMVRNVEADARRHIITSNYT